MPLTVDPVPEGVYVSTLDYALAAHGLLVYRHAVDTAPHVRRALHALVGLYIRLGWLDPPAAHPCVVCGRPAQEWHHPSYQRGLHERVQAACQPCHQRGHARALRGFAAAPGGEWACWHTEEQAGAVRQLIAEALAAEAEDQRELARQEARHRTHELTLEWVPRPQVGRAPDAP